MPNLMNLTYCHLETTTAKFVNYHLLYHEFNMQLLAFANTAIRVHLFNKYREREYQVRA